MNKPAMPRVDLKLAMDNANLDELDQVAEELGRQAIAVALAEAGRPQHLEEDRQRMLDAALGDVMEIVNRHRLRLGRRVCSMSDAKVTRQMFEMLRGMADRDGGADSDPSFQ